MITMAVPVTIDALHVKASTFQAPTFELSLRIFLCELKNKNNFQREKLKSTFRELVEQFVEELSASATIEFNDEILNVLVDTAHISDIAIQPLFSRSKSRIFRARCIIRELVECYLEALVTKCQLFITNRKQFDAKLGTIGIYRCFPVLPLSTQPPTLRPTQSSSTQTTTSCDSLLELFSNPIVLFFAFGLMMLVWALVHRM